ncbi:VOC family protein [Marinimicrobium sp. ABcell2]|uniref:VOC family protein n=1 Tax=Marinimicrobium sp. ABcell2 TaxID=3069751 RepID=UPI0027B30829|nr:VOC family protein [Marinimicrobium sp. ABcell2]MDQ2075848.1 VOC family protein [Marinimicrobium sp. ABcell2]
MSTKGNIDYVEMPCRDIEATKAFFTKAFGWSFVDYGPDYTALSGAGLDGGFFRSNLVMNTNNGSALVVVYSKDLDACLSAVDNAGGSIVKPIFAFPGGRRFHFSDPSGNEYAVWSDQEV